MIKYLATSNGLGKVIRKVDVDRETAKSFYIRGARYSKGSECFDSWDEAHSYLVIQAKHELDMQRLALQRAQGHYGNVKGMKNTVDE